MTTAESTQELLQPGRIWSSAEVFSPTSPVPKRPGVYAFYFKIIPGSVPTVGCKRFRECTLLYVGISPDKPSNQPSTHTLADRIRFHYTGNAHRSTLRLSLGCLLSKELGIQLQVSDTGKSKTFSTGEKKLTEWMSENAFVAWTVHPEPWLLEETVFSQASLPLNIKHNPSNEFAAVLKQLRKEANFQANKKMLGRP